MGVCSKCLSFKSFRRLYFVARAGVYHLTAARLSRRRCGARRMDQCRSFARVAGARCCSLTFMTTDQELFALAERVGQKLRGAGRRLATAESCTGGWVAKACTDVAGSSQWFECGFVTYSNAAKVRDVGVSERALVDHGAVSEATVREMAAGALRVSGADVAVAISGIAGPDGGTQTKPVGTVWFGLASRRGADVVVIAEKELFGGDRELVRRRSVERALQMVVEIEWSAKT
jgi:nicotinamide-nucleotide amidase